jgi:hypothetical protein
MFSKNAKGTLSVIFEHLGLRNGKGVSLRIKDVVADDMCELFEVVHAQTVPTSSNATRNLLTTFLSGRNRVAQVRECVVEDTVSGRNECT